MKKSAAPQLFFSIAFLSLSAINALAGYVTPTVAPAPAPAYHFPPNPNPAPGVWIVSNHLDDGPGSLRYAISNAASGDTIRFKLKRLPAVILLQSTLVIDKDLTILGPGPRKIIVARTFKSKTPSYRVFRVDGGIVTIAGLSIANGRALNPDGVSDNLGGGIYNRGSLTVSNCIIVRNFAEAENGGNGFGGGIFTDGPLTVVGSTIRDNEANYAGGGLCTFHSGTVRIKGCTINGNFAGIQGGGVNFQGRMGSFENCTISGNSTAADGTASGLLHLVFENEASDLDLTACTITGNYGNTNGAVVFAALANNLGSNTRMIETLVADNAAPNFFLDGNPVVLSLGHNLDSDGTSGLVNGVNGDLVGTLANPLDARLGPLQNNGGPTWTHALLPGSPALDAGACETIGWPPPPPMPPLQPALEQAAIIIILNGDPLATDQRGLPRPQGAACDIGAFENQPPQVHCPMDQYVNASRDKLTAVVYDPDGDPLTVVWFVDGAAYQTTVLRGIHPPSPQPVKLKVSLSPGDHTIGLSVSDGKAAAVECSTTVTARNGKPPQYH